MRHGDFDQKHWFLGGDDLAADPKDGAKEIHEAAFLMPTMGTEDLDRLGYSLNQNGLREPIVVWKKDGRVIDGRHRLLCFTNRGISLTKLRGMTTSSGGPAVVEFDGNDADVVRYVLDRNLNRRHLSLTEKKGVNEKLKALLGVRQKGGVAGTKPSNAANAALPPTQSDRANMLGVDRATVQRWDADDKQVSNPQPKPASVPDPEPVPKPQPVSNPKSPQGEILAGVEACDAFEAACQQFWTAIRPDHPDDMTAAEITVLRLGFFFDTVCPEAKVKLKPYARG